MNLNTKNIKSTTSTWPKFEKDTMKKEPRSSNKKNKKPSNSENKLRNFMKSKNKRKS